MRYCKEKSKLFISWKRQTSPFHWYTFAVSSITSSVIIFMCLVPEKNWFCWITRYIHTHTEYSIASPYGIPYLFGCSFTADFFVGVFFPFYIMYSCTMLRHHLNCHWIYSEYFIVLNKRDSETKIKASLFVRIWKRQNENTIVLHTNTHTPIEDFMM